ncbi:hypothetical protein GCM10022223_59820 [Kineosporia mesophila]|uniref:Sarcosine oxidase subunit gamma n=1 Tax=Kineosporia mesophila TaxID=566012 RepID=A0ABP7AIS5_9ACTN|nr:sarcosine oxidase subunit gamma family protein [Kineosporia mesophila]MCD5352437.1 hypothetical protein [Kineosporia mesophila]
MADTLYRSQVLPSDVFAALPEGLSVTIESHVAMAGLRLRDLAEVLNTTPPVQPNTWAATPDGQMVWLGPDEWLVTSRDQQPHELESTLREAVKERGGAAVDVSAQRLSLRLSGVLARDLLSLGCSLDLHPSVFTVGSSAQTALGMTNVVLLALDSAGEDYRIFVRSSFAGYLADWIVDASAEYVN